MNTHNTRTYYLRSIPRPNQKRGDPIACLMTSVDWAGNVIKYSIATMHPKDEFKKPLGRKIANGRLKESPAIVWVDKMPSSGHVISRLIMEDIVARFEQSSRFKREYILRTYGNNWAYHIPARVAKAAQRWLDAASKPRNTIPVPEKVWTAKDLTGKYTGSITCDPKDAPLVEVKTAVGGTIIPTISVVGMNKDKAINNPGLPSDGAVVSAEWSEWVQDGKGCFVRSNPTEESLFVKKMPVKNYFSSPKQQANYEFFLKVLPSLLTNKFLVGKFAIVSDNDIRSFLNTYQEALEHALIKYKAGEFIIHEVANSPATIYEQKSA